MLNTIDKDAIDKAIHGPHLQKADPSIANSLPWTFP